MSSQQQASPCSSSPYSDAASNLARFSSSDTTPSPTAAAAAITWTPAQEQRLLHVQYELREAQKRWSESQDLWLEEVEHLLEIKRSHKRAQKKTLKNATARPETASSILRARTWRPKSWAGRRKSEPGPLVDSDKDEDEDDGDDEEENPAVSPRQSGLGNAFKHDESLEQTSPPSSRSSPSSFSRIARRFSMPIRNRRKSFAADEAGSVRSDSLSLPFPEELPEDQGRKTGFGLKRLATTS